MAPLEKKARTRTPAALNIGLVLLALVIAGFLFGDPTPLMFLALLVGLALLCTGLIQRSIESRR